MANRIDRLMPALALVALAGCASDQNLQDTQAAARDVPGTVICPAGQTKICDKTTDRLACKCTRMLTRPSGGTTPHR